MCRIQDQRMSGFSCSLCLLRTCNARTNFVAFRSDCQNGPWMYFGKAVARSLHRPPTRPHPHQFRPSFHHTVKSTLGRAWKIFTGPAVMTAGDLPSHSELMYSSILLGTQGHPMCCRRQLIIPPGNQDSRYEKVVSCDVASPYIPFQRNT